MKKILLIVALLAALGFQATPMPEFTSGLGSGFRELTYGPGPYYGYGYPYYGYPGYGYPGPYYSYYPHGYYPWYRGYWHGGYYHGGYYGHGAITAATTITRLEA